MNDGNRTLRLALLWLHAASIIVACALVVVGLALRFREKPFSMASPNAILSAYVQIAGAYIALISLGTGIGLMATGSRPNKSIGVAAPTFLAFLLLFFAC